MTNQKLYALKTSDTGEWVKWDYKFRDRPGYRLWDYPVEIVPEDQRFICLSARASKDTGHPCEWVEVWVVEAKDVTETVLHLEAENIIQEHRIGYATETLKLLSIMDMKRGFRACLRYLGVG